MEQQEKSFNQLIQPYIKTILFAVIATLVFTFVFDYFLRDRNNVDVELIAQFERKRDSLLNVIEIQDKQLNKKETIIQEQNKLLKDKEVEEKRIMYELDSLKRKGVRVEEIKGNDSKYAAAIDAAFDIADEYLELDTYLSDSHSDIINELIALYSIKGLSDSQNRGLVTRIRMMNGLQIMDFVKKAKSMNQEQIISESKRLSELKSLTKTQKQLLNTVGMTLKRKTHVVKENETLFLISRKYNVKIETLKELNPNKIDENGNIKAGDVLKISN